MRALLLCLALLLAAPAYAQWEPPQEKEENLELKAQQPLQRYVIPYALRCDTFEQLHSIIMAAMRDGNTASNEVFARLNAAQKKPVCESFNLTAAQKRKMRPKAFYEAVEAHPGELRDMVVVSLKEKGGKTSYIVIQRIRARGFTL